MSLVIDPSFNGFDYASQSADIERWKDEGYIRSAVMPVPRSHVNRGRPGYHAPRQITLDGTIGNTAWTTRDQLRTAEDAFRYAHRAGFWKLFRDTDRYVTAEVRTLTMGEDTGLLFIPFSVHFEAADPYWYNSTPDATDTWNHVAPPAAPTLTAFGTGGSLAAGAYWVKITWVTAAGEELPSAVVSQVTTGATSRITVTPPGGVPAGATGYNVYCGMGATEPADGIKFPQNGGTPIGTASTFTFSTLVVTGTGAFPSASVTHAITNSGSTDTPPKFTFTTGAAAGTLALTLYLDTPTTGFASFSLNGAVNAADVIVVDCAAQTVTLNGVNAMNLFTGTFFNLPPGASTLRAVYSGEALASIATDKTQRWL